MARDQSYLVSYISKLTQYCDVLLLKGAYRIGMDEIVRNVNNGNINYVNLASPLIKAEIKEDPDKFISKLEHQKINVLNNIQYLPEIIPYLQSLYSTYKREGKLGLMKIIISTCADIHTFEGLQQILAEKMFIANLYPASTAEALGYNANILDKLYSKNLSPCHFAGLTVAQAMTKATFVNFPDEYQDDYFDEFLNSILNQNISSLYNLNSPSKTVKIMTELTNFIGRITPHGRICRTIALDDITYPHYYQGIIDSFIGFELSSIPHQWLTETEQSSEPDSCSHHKNNTKFYFIDSNLLAYLKGTVINRKIQGDFITFNQLYQNFVVSELRKITSANAGISLWFMQEPQCRMDVVITREDQSAIGFKIRGNDQITDKDLQEFANFRQLLGDRFFRGYVIYLGSELKEVQENIYALPINFLWSDPC